MDTKLNDLQTPVNRLKVLAVSTRMRIIQLLKGRALCGNALAARLNITPGAVSQHLRIIRDAGLVVGEKRGCFVHYRLNEETLAAWRQEIDKLLDPENVTYTDKKGTAKCVAKKDKMAAKNPKT
ncbi:MAG: metalloregulator ArsR/SmtB family transcription factor [Planctomycetota bacterium]|nr:metalloregulator ArsR/SmtB family transcription factor [Planctomycetota bacterium]